MNCSKLLSVKDIMRSRLRRFFFLLGLAPLVLLAPCTWAQGDEFEGDPYKSFPWRDMRREYLGKDAVVQFDERVKVLGPGFAEDPMNVPISVSANAIPNIDKVVIMVDRNPIRKVLEFYPLSSLPSVSFRFKLEQASPVRAAVHTRDGIWHVGGTWVDSSGGGCTVPGETRKDGSWTNTLGQVAARMYSQSTPDSASRLRFRVMHPMDTGLVGGIPAFYINKLSVVDGDGRQLAWIQGFEPLSENPVFSFDFAMPPKEPISIVGGDNNGNRIEGKVQ
jgi:sulfur-oxidizing protein SoxY